MCYDPNDQPPTPAGAKRAANGEDIVLRTSDGVDFAGFVAHSGAATPSQVLIYPDVRGLHQFYKELALRFAEVGVNALAIDYFGRTAGLTARDEKFEYMPHVQQMTLENFTHEVWAGVEYLKQRFGNEPKTYVVGFCMGGSLTLMTGTNAHLGFAGLIPFYSGFSRSYGQHGTALENADRVKYPVLGIYGGADPGIPESQVKQLDATLDATGVWHDIVIYPGAPHSFFDRKFDDYAEASADAWARVLKFVGGAR